MVRYGTVNQSYYKVAGWSQYYGKINGFSLIYIILLKAEAAQQKYTFTGQDKSVI